MFGPCLSLIIMIDPQSLGESLPSVQCVLHLFCYDGRWLGDWNLSQQQKTSTRFFLLLAASAHPSLAKARESPQAHDGDFQRLYTKFHLPHQPLASCLFLCIFSSGACKLASYWKHAGWMLPFSMVGRRRW